MPHIHIHSHGLSLCYEALGDPQAPPLLLIMGLGIARAHVVGASMGGALPPTMMI